MKMSTFVHCWWENLLTKSEEDVNLVDTWEKFVECVLKDFYPPKYMEQQYKKWQQLTQWNDQIVQSYPNRFLQLMARLGVMEEEKLLVLK